MSESEALFWYNESAGLNFSYFYNLHSTYIPQFSVTPSNETLSEVEKYCTVGGTIDIACEYDYLRTGNAIAAAATLTASAQNNETQIVLGMSLASWN